MGDTLLRVLTICLPVFAMVGFGTWLRRIGWLDDAARAFLNRFLYHFALPTLVFLGVAAQDFRALMDPAIAVTVVATTVLAGGLFFALGSLGGLRGGARATLAHSAFWGNVTYLGFPLAKSAFGEEGLAYACIVNAFGMPAFVIIGILMLSMAGERKLSLARQLRQALASPVVMAAFAGVFASLVLNELGLAAWAASQPAVGIAWTLVRRFLDMLGSVGLPLALIAVGGALRLELVRGRIGLMAVGALAKLIIGPAVAWGLITLGTSLGLWPQPPPAALGATVLLMAMPLAVAAYVISDQLGVEPGLNAGLMVLSTLLACLTVPVWLALLL